MDYLPKDPAILVSSVNMLLRDEEFDTLESLCYAFNKEPRDIKDLIKREQSECICFAESENSRTKFKRMLFTLMAMVCVLTLSAQRPRVGELSSGMSIYDFKVKDDIGQEVSLSDYKGKVLLIVNTATRCGFTPQYKELEALYEKYRSEGLEILDFPCNQFGEQAPGTIQEIHQFCSANFNIQFPQFDKIEVNGANEHPLYTWLKAQKGFSSFDVNDLRGKMMDGMLRKQDADYDKKSDIKWNFTKFLVSRDGRVLKRYEPTDQITAIEADICMEVNPDEQPDAKPRDASKVKYIK